MKYTIIINRIIDIIQFVNTCSRMSCSNEILLRQGAETVNAASLMGVLSIDLSKPTELEVPSFIGEEEKEILLNYILPFMVIS